LVRLVRQMAPNEHPSESGGTGICIWYLHSVLTLIISRPCVSKLIWVPILVSIDSVLGLIALLGANWVFGGGDAMAPRQSKCSGMYFLIM